MQEIGRISYIINGAVQGVGFRPFVYRLAHSLFLKGWVINGNNGVVIDVEGSLPDLKEFTRQLKHEKPPAAIIHEIQESVLEPCGYTGFFIQESSDEEKKTAFLLPDLSICPQCRVEIFDKDNRRYLYPFTNCTYCGPRFSIIKNLPYDRVSTSMDDFPMCPDCLAEYKEPSDRRFHTQSNTCDKCGPQYTLYDKSGMLIAEKHDAFVCTAGGIEAGRIAAIKGIGGFHLVVDALNDKAVSLLRSRKKRLKKPFALMMRDIEQVKQYCLLSIEEETLLLSKEAPIVLLKKRHNCLLSPAVAPGNPYIGVMLPYSPALCLLMSLVDRPVVATSGNLTDEPICTDNEQAFNRLGLIADLFLVHNRVIQHQADDSVAMIMMRAPVVIRRSRGYAPLPVIFKEKLPVILALGGQLKNTISLSIGSTIFISSYLGDMESLEASSAFEKTINDFLRIYNVKPSIIAYDLHPEYTATKWVMENRFKNPLFTNNCKPVGIQHHQAHLASCLAENNFTGDVLGVVWDGTGYGTDNTIWGGEFFVGNSYNFRRIGRIKPFLLPGAAKAIDEPSRVAISLLWGVFGSDIFLWNQFKAIQDFPGNEKNILKLMLQKKLNSPETSSIGRLFDGIASLLNLCHKNDFEAEASMIVEFAANEGHFGFYNFSIEKLSEKPCFYEIDFSKMIKGIVLDIENHIETGIIAARFHDTLVQWIEDMAFITGKKTIALSGGCFQNKRLVEDTVTRLQEKGYQVLSHNKIPTNDGGISLGQIVLAARCPADQLI